MTVRDALPTAPSDRFREKPIIETVGERFRRLPLGPRVRRWLKHLYLSALMLRSGGRGLQCVLPDGEHIRALPEFRHISWNPSEYRAFKKAVRPGQVALDVGANVGAYALLLGQWVGPGGRVFAFEPVAEVHTALARHVDLNGLGAVVRPIDMALADRESATSLIVSGTSGESRLAAPGEGGEVRDVRATTIDAFCAREAVAPDFIKIDVEGWDVSVRRGARETSRARGASLALFVELHPSIWPSLNMSRRDLEMELDVQNLQLAPLTPGEDPWSVEGVAVRLTRRVAAI